MAIPSLAMIPSGYKDGKVYSVLPSNGDGDFTFSRGSNATRVNKDGLIEIMPLEVSDTELITNGGFATDSDWIKQTGWTISGGVASSDGTQTSTVYLYQTGIGVIGKTYKCEFEITSYTSGSIKLSSNGNDGTYASSTGIHTEYLTFLASSCFMTVTPDFVGSIDNVSVKEVLSGLDTPRLDYSDSSCPSLLLEPQRTNLVTYSEAFDNAYWTKSNTSVVSGFTSPDGTTNAFKLVENSNNSSHILYKNNITTGSGKTTLSIKAKAGERKWILLGDFEQGNRVYFDLENGVAGTVLGSPNSYSITALQNGWYDITLTTTATTKIDFQVYLATGNNQEIYQGDGTSGIYMWGAQLEEGSYATSYIPTNGATATRLADICTDAGTSDTFNDSEGVLMVEAATLVESLTQNHIISIHDGTANNRVRIYWREDVPSQLIFSVFNGGALIYTYTITSIALDDMNKVCLRYGSNNFSAWVNGFKLDEQTSGGSLSLQLNTLDFNNVSGASGNAFQGKTKQIQYYNSSLTDSEIEEISSWESFLDMANGQNYTIK